MTKQKNFGANENSSHNYILVIQFACNTDTNRVFETFVSRIIAGKARPDEKSGDLPVILAEILSTLVMLMRLI